MSEHDEHDEKAANIVNDFRDNHQHGGCYMCSVEDGDCIFNDEDAVQLISSFAAALREAFESGYKAALRNQALIDAKDETTTIKG